MSDPRAAGAEPPCAWCQGRGTNNPPEGVCGLAICHWCQGTGKGGHQVDGEIVGVSLPSKRVPLRITTGGEIRRLRAELADARAEAARYKAALEQARRALTWPTTQAQIEAGEAVRAALGGGAPRTEGVG